MQRHYTSSLTASPTTDELSSMLHIMRASHTFRRGN